LALWWSVDGTAVVGKVAGLTVLTVAVGGLGLLYLSPLVVVVLLALCVGRLWRTKTGS
jgi:hypothetical protein